MTEEETDPEFPEDKMAKIQRVADLYEFERQAQAENIKFSHLPYWRQLQLEGDYLSIDAGTVPGDEL